ncbi:MAG: hypothetical protein K9K37_06215 [Desulfocapsa sp.]|nr:hypothetical protein [Desulfocapsa sp.]
MTHRNDCGGSDSHLDPDTIPSLLGQAHLAQQQWSVSPWADGVQCMQTQQTLRPWLLLLMD